MSLYDQYETFIKANNLFQRKDRLLLAVSGGVDSVVLCHLMKETGYDFAIAHCNFQLRGGESEKDESFVEALAKKYGVSFFVTRFDTKSISRESRTSIEESARELRYAWFEELLSEHAFDRIATAHHADDNIETVAMNFFRGTGLKGLTGISAKRGKIVRPILFATKDQIEAFAKEKALACRKDQTNDENEFTRNHFRNQVLPLIEAKYPAARQNIESNISRLNEAYILYMQAIELHKKKLVEQKGNEFHIPVLKLKKSQPLNTIVYELIKEFGFSAHQTEDVVKLLDSVTGKYVVSATHRILKNRNWLIISPLQTPDAINILIEQGQSKIEFSAGKIVIDSVLASKIEIDADPSVALLNAGEIEFPLILRPWKKGDYFYPLGMKKKKKLSRFFIDRKLSLAEKERVWVLESNRRIIWVVGQRIDERVKVRPDTNNILKITFYNK